MARASALQRHLSLPLFTFYGLGSILGAGIYALVGKVAGDAGMFTPIAFVISALLAAFTGLSYAELASRFPRSGGEAIYVFKAFRIPKFSLIVGIFAALAATVSAAALSTAFVGYLRVFVPLNYELAIVLVVLCAAVIAAWGIRQSAFATAAMTLIEIGGLFLIVWVGRHGLASVGERLPELVPSLEFGVWQGILVGAFIAFYAFIGFEDMANVAEEVKDPHRTIPRGIILAVIGATSLYCIVALTAVLSLSGAELSSTDAPLAMLYERETGNAPVLITFISLFAIVNGLLVQIIMASRVVYGLSKECWIPSICGYVNPRTHTPLVATALITGIIIALALWLPLATLAQITSLIILVIFAIVNVACIRIKLRDPNPKGVRTFPMAVPVLGFVVIVIFVIARAALLFVENGVGVGH